MAGDSPSTLVAGRYRTLRRLGAGGVATVYLAEDERLGRPVALKRLRAGSPQEMARRFEREARLGASLNHPNLVAVYDITTETTELLIVMEYVEGASLAEALRDGPLPDDKAVTVLRGVAAGLDHAHAGGVIHRDVKPANVLLGDDGRTKLADLGIATAAAATDITGTGALLGTPAYMAPEQFSGGDIGPAADVYGLAAVAFETFSGQRARPGRTPMEVAHRVTTEPPPDLRNTRPDAPPALAHALRDGMALDPAERPRSAGDLVERLAAGMVHDRGPARAGAAAAAVPLGDAPAEAPAAPGEAPTEAAAEEPGVPATLAAESEATAHPEPEAVPTKAEDRPPPAHPVPPAAPRARPRRRGPAAAVAAVALLGLGVVLALLLIGPDAEPPAPEPDATGEPGGSEGAAAPDEAVVDFYTLSADGDYRGAWALATPDFRAQLQGFASFQESQSTLESIEFERAETVEENGDSATVEIQTVADHTDGVDQCQGTLDLVAGPDGGWLIDGASITCPQSTRG